MSPAGARAEQTWQKVQPLCGVRHVLDRDVVRCTLPWGHIPSDKHVARIEFTARDTSTVAGADWGTR
jgi:hypothetical protein